MCFIRWKKFGESAGRKNKKMKENSDFSTEDHFFDLGVNSADHARHLLFTVISIG